MSPRQVLDFDKKTKDATKWRANLNTDDVDSPRVEIHKKCTHHGDVGEIDIVVEVGSDISKIVDEGYVTIKTKGVAKLSILEASDLSIALDEAIKWIQASKGHRHGPDSDSGIRYE